jgi:hypothetical protein
MKTSDLIKSFKIFSVIFFLSILIYSCNENPVETLQSDDDYLRTTAINSSFSNDDNDDDNILSSEILDFDGDGIVADDENNVPVDSVIRWGRRITNVNTNATITNLGDSLKQVDVVKTISGNLIIVVSTAGVIDTVSKPFIQEQKRIVIFKRVGNRPNPRFNWRLYKYSAIDGETKQPQVGKSNITMSKVEVYRNNNLIMTLDGPDFTVNMFNARRFFNNGNFENNPNAQIRLKVYLTSNQSDQDLVMFHWARNNHGHHRVRFNMTSEIQVGSNWERTFEKTFNIFPNHRLGIFNGYISSSTRATLFDDDPSLLSTTYMGLVYGVRPH